MRDIPLREVLDLLDLDELYRLQWGGRGSGAAFDAIVKSEFEPARMRLEADATAHGWLRPEAAYGYFPAQADGNAIVVYDPAAFESDGGARREIARFAFPRQAGRERLCLADYVRPAASDEVDVIGLQIVTVGTAAAEK